MRVTGFCLLAIAILAQGPLFPANSEAPPELPPTVEGLLNLQGKPVSWSKKPDAAATVIVFTAHECPVANRSVPDLNRIVEFADPGGIDFLILHTDPKADVSDIREHTRDYEVAAPVLIDRDHVFVRLLGARMTPEAFLFDSEGRLVYRGRINDRFTGFGESRPAPTRHELKEVLEKLLDGEKLPYREIKGFGCTLLVDPGDPE